MSDDWELLAKSATDSGAYTRLVERHYAASVGFAFQILHDHQKAEDVVSRSFVNIFLGRDRFEERARFRTFLFKVVSNLALNELAKRSGSVDLSSLAPEDGSAEERIADTTTVSADPGDIVEGREAAEMIRQGVMKLPPKHRAALYLREYADQSYLEIAETLQASLAEVKIWIYRGRQRLQKLLEPYLDRGDAVT